MQTIKSKFLKRLEHYSEKYENGDTKILSFIILFFGIGFFNALFAVYFSFNGSIEMAIYNMLGATASIVSIYLMLFKGNYLIAHYLMVFNVSFYIICSTYFWGYSKDAFLLCYPLLFFCYTVSPAEKKHIQISTFISGLTMLITLFLKYNVIAKYENQFQFVKIVNFFYGIIATFFIVYIVSFSEKLLSSMRIVEMQALLKEVYTDFLTGLKNKRYIEEIIQTSSSLENSYVVIADIDFFKKVNDTYGHSVGDYVLKEISEMALHFFRSEDIVSRWGGEEFLFLVKDINSTAVMKRINELREKISLKNFSYDNYNFQITMTFGVEKIDSSVSIQEIFKRADSALYLGKQSGRNKVVFYEPSSID